MSRPKPFQTAAVDAAFASAAHVQRVRLADTRLAPVTMEPRAGIGLWDEATQRYTLIASTQGVGTTVTVLLPIAAAPQSVAVE